ncbi:phosphotransferase family protein [Halomicroarcula sp. GCM10025709]|uniref:phosphotransferase family protein n=1 Tax=Haloarcula TaxID=2237 RepID=UPI0024C2CB47|nr:phosphotransferase [Halomicroarcula sp. YJ-61-S]
MTDSERVLRRVVPTRSPETIERPRQGNHKETTVARYTDYPAVVVQLADDADAIHTEAVLLGAVAERTSVPVPRLLAHGRLGGRGYLVTEHVDGADLHERFVGLPAGRRQHLARRFGIGLARLHAAFPFESAGSLSVESDGSLVAAGLAPAEAFTAAAEDALTALPGPFDDLRPALLAALDPPERTRRPRLFPWDLRPGNALVSGGDLAAVLDWGDPRAADPALSIAKTEHLVTRWYGTDPDPLRSAFRAGYRSVRPLPAVPRAYRLAAVVTAAVDSQGVVTRPHYPERTGEAAVAIHRAWMTEWLDAGESE